MARGQTRYVRREVFADPKYNQVLVTQFVNTIMREGKKSLAEKIFYQCLEIIQKQMQQDGVAIFQKAVNNVKPMLEVKSRRVGGANYQIPMEVSSSRRTSLAIRWLVHFAKERKGKSMSERMADEIMAAYKNEGGAIKKRNDLQKMAEANRAFAHFRY